MLAGDMALTFQPLQIKADVAYSNTNVKLCGQSSGVAYGELGPTHHSIEDFAWLRPLTNLMILVPSDPWETAEAVKFAAQPRGARLHPRQPDAGAGALGAQPRLPSRQGRTGARRL